MLPCLTQRKRKVIADAMYDDCKHPIDDNDLGAIGLLPRDKVIAALRKFYRAYGTTAARDLARKLQSKRPSKLRAR